MGCVVAGGTAKRPGMSPQEFEDRVLQWAQGVDGLEALILGGSRATANTSVDEWSDWDFHVITRRPRDLAGTGWLDRIGPVWCAQWGVSPRGALKISAVFEGGLEADFIPISPWKMRLLYAAMRRPDRAKWYPGALRGGIHEVRKFMHAFGWRVMVGGAEWEQRLEALHVAWPERFLTEAEFDRTQAEFWPKAVWLLKKVARPEPRSAMHGLHAVLLAQVYPLLEEEARVAGKKSRSEARKAERWLDPERMSQTAIATDVEKVTLARALLATIDLFTEAAAKVAALRGFRVAEHAAVEEWLRSELARIVRRG